MKNEAQKIFMGGDDPPVKPDKHIPVKPDVDPDPTKKDPGPDPEKNDPTRIDNPEKVDPTRIPDPNKNDPSKP